MVDRVDQNQSPIQTTLPTADPVPVSTISSATPVAGETQEQADARAVALETKARQDALREADEQARAAAEGGSAPPAPETAPGVPKLITQTSGYDRYVVEVDGRRQYMTAAEIEAAGGTVPETTKLEQEAMKISQDEDIPLYKAEDRVFGDYYASKLGMTREELQTPVTGSNHADVMINLARKYNLGLDAVVNTLDRYNRNPDDPEFSNFNRWMRQDFDKLTGIDLAGLQHNASLHALQVFNDLQKTNPKAMYGVSTGEGPIGGYIVLNVEEAVKSGVTDADLFNYLGIALRETPTLIKMNDADPGTMAQNGFGGFTQGDIYEITQQPRRQAEAETEYQKQVDIWLTELATTDPSGYFRQVYDETLSKTKGDIQAAMQAVQIASDKRQTDLQAISERQLEKYVQSDDFKNLPPNIKALFQPDNLQPFYDAVDKYVADSQNKFENWIDTEAPENLRVAYRTGGAKAYESERDKTEQSLTELSMTAEDYDRYLASAPEDKFNTLLALGMVEAGSTFGGVDANGDVMVYPPGVDGKLTPGKVATIAAESVVPFLYVSRHWGELPTLPTLSQIWVDTRTGKQYTSDERNELIANFEAKRDELIRKGQIGSEEWNALGSNPRDVLSRQVDNLLNSKVSLLALDTLSVLPVLGWLGKAGAASATTASEVGKINRAVQAIKSAAYAAKTLPKGALIDFPKQIATKPISALQSLVDVTVYPIAHPVSTAKTIAKIATGKVQLGNFIPEGTLTLTGAYGRTVPMRTVTGQILNINAPTATDILSPKLTSGGKEYVVLKSSGKVPTVTYYEQMSRDPITRPLTPDEYSIMKVLKSSPEAAVSRAQAIRGKANQYGFRSVIDEYGIKQVKAVFPEAKSYARAEMAVERAIKPARDEANRRVAEAVTKFTNETLNATRVSPVEYEAMRLQGYPEEAFFTQQAKTITGATETEYFLKGTSGGERGWKNLAAKGFIQTAVPEQTEVTYPGREAAIREIANNPMDFAVMPGGAWRAIPKANANFASLKLNYPVYITDPGMIARIWKARQGTIVAYGEMASQSGSEEEFLRLVRQGGLAEPTDVTMTEVKAEPFAEIQTRVPAPTDPIMNAYPWEELKTLLDAGAIRSEAKIPGNDTSEQARWLTQAIISDVANMGWAETMYKWGELPVLAVYPYAFEMVLSENSELWKLSDEDRINLISRIKSNEVTQDTLSRLSPDARSKALASFQQLTGKFTGGEGQRIMRPDHGEFTTRAKLEGLGALSESELGILSPKADEVVAPAAQTATSASVATRARVQTPSAIVQTGEPVPVNASAVAPELSNIVNTEAVLPGITPTTTPRRVPSKSPLPASVPSPVPATITSPMPFKSPYEDANEESQAKGFPNLAPIPESVSRPAPALEPIPEPEPEPEPQPEPVPAPIPVPEPIPTPTPVPVPIPTPIPIPVPKPDPVKPPPPPPPGKSRSIVASPAGIIIPEGSIAWAQGALQRGKGRNKIPQWWYIPPPWDQDEAISLSGPPHGAKNIDSIVPSETIQIIGRTRKVVPKYVSKDLGWADIEIINGSNIRFASGGEKTNVGTRLPSETKGIEVSGSTVVSGKTRMLDDDEPSTAQKKKKKIVYRTSVGKKKPARKRISVADEFIGDISISSIRKLTGL